MLLPVLADVWVEMAQGEGNFNKIVFAMMHLTGCHVSSINKNMCFNAKTKYFFRREIGNIYHLRVCKSFVYMISVSCM